MRSNARKSLDVGVSVEESIINAEDHNPSVEELRSMTSRE